MSQHINVASGGHGKFIEAIGRNEFRISCRRHPERFATVRDLSDLRCCDACDHGVSVPQAPHAA